MKHMKTARRFAWVTAGGAILNSAASSCTPPPSFEKDVQAVKESAMQGVENTEKLVETAKDPEKREKAVEKLKEDLKNPPRQFK